MTPADAITAVSGIRVGHWTNADGPTGCTVVLCPPGNAAAVDLRGGAPGTRNTDLLRAGTLLQGVDAILLTGGSEFGLDAATGVVRWLEERGIGFPLQVGVVPIVSAAVIFDLSLGRADVRPNAQSGYDACQAATDGEIQQGSVGAGTGATVGKVLGLERALKGGLSTAAERTASGITIGALVVINCFGQVCDPSTGNLIAGPRGEQTGSFVDTVDTLQSQPPASPFLAAAQNTVLGVVATDAMLNKDQARRLAVMAQAGLAATIRPAHSPVDGDTMFAVATRSSEQPADVLQLGALAARAVERAVVRAISKAEGIAGVPSAAQWTGQHLPSP